MNESQNYICRLRKLDCCTVSDALDHLKLAGVVSGVPQRSGSGLVAGIVITVKLGSKAADKGSSKPRHLGTTAIELGGPDNVIVIEQHTGIEAGSWGGLLTLGAKLRGINGVIADGPVRDIDEARALEFPVFAKSLTARTARGRIVEEATNVPILVWDRKVDPGDYVIADNSSVIFISCSNIEKVLEQAEAIASREAAMAKSIREGTPISEVMGGSYENMLKS
ncbi:MAG: 4-hydroxy-4-methyl-2-oxoglutarate aldolase [Parasphingorhabdus sp.]|jgi:4-hydroxy-4-methyl-2-oxoglutarate aldolase